MDVQTENTDPPPCESQPSGKIRKGFKLFGKRKPGNIFSMRSKGDGNNKSPVIRSSTTDGLSDTPAPDSEQDTDKEKGHEVSQGESEQAEEEPLSDDGVLAAAPARTSISSASSAKSLSFLSLLRGGRRGVGDRRSQTVSQPVGRQRRGIKDLFGSVKFRSKDKDDRKSAPPSPLLMSSRANSVEIIKEDLTLTPKSQPRSLDSPDTETCEPLKSLTGQDSAVTSPSKSPLATTGNVSKTTEHVSPLSTPEPPLVPGDTSLSSLLADISSLLTFDSITGGDIMADVEAEWGKATSAPSTAVTQVSPSSSSPFSKPTVSPKLTSTFVSTAVPVKPSPVATVASSSQPLTPLTKTISSPISKPSSIITTFTKSSTLTTQSVKLSSDSTPTTELKTNIKISTPAPAAIKLTNAPATLTSFSASVTSSSSTTNKSVPSVTSTVTTAPSTTPSTVAKAPVVGSVITTTTTKLASETAVPQKPNASVSKPSSVAPSSSTSDKPAAATHTPPIPVTPVQPPPYKLDLANNLNSQTSTADKSRSVAGGDLKAVIVTSTCTITTQSSSHALTSASKTTTVSVQPATVSGSVSVTMSKPIPTSSPMNLNKTSSSHVPDVSPSSTLPVTSKILPGPATPQISSSASLDKTPLTTKPTSLPSSTDKIPAIPEPIPAPTTQAAISTASPTPAAPPQVPAVQSKSPAVSAPTPVPVSKDLPASAKIQDSQPKPSPSPAQVPVSVTKDPIAPVQMQVSQSTPPQPPVQIPVSVLKAHPFTPITPAPVSTDTPAAVSVPLSVSKDIPAPAQIPLPQSKAPSALVTMPCPVTPPVSTRAPEPAALNSTGAHAVQSPLIKTEEQPNETQRNLHGPSKEKKTSQPRPSGLSKIPVVGGGRVGKLPVRDSQHADEEPIRDPPTPVLEEEKPHLNSHDAGSKEKSIGAEAKSPPSKRSPEESPQQSKVSASSGRDSKIPVKHGVQSHTASQIPQSKEPPRTKIPVSKVPVRRVGNKPASTSSSQIRK